MKMHIDLNPSWHGYEAEMIEISLLDNDVAEVLSPPFFAKDLSVGDRVRVRVAANKLEYVKTIKKSDNSVYRIYFSTKKNITNIESIEEKLNPLILTKRRFNESDYTLISIAVYPDNVAELYGILESMLEKEIVDFEEGSFRGLHK